MKVTIADGSSTIARALIDPGSSASFVMSDLHSIYVYCVVIKMLVWKEVQEPLHLHEDLYSSECLTLRMVQRKLG